MSESASIPIDPRWLDLFRQELSEITARLEAAGVALCEAYAREHVDVAFRGLHTLKGNSFALGFAGMGELAHRFEHVLDQARQSPAALPVPVLGELLLDATDAFRRMADEPDAPAPRALLERIDALAAEAGALVAADAPAFPQTVPATAAAPASQQTAPAPDAASPTAELSEAIVPPPERRESLVIPVDVEALDALVSSTESLRALASADGVSALSRRAEELSRDLLGVRQLPVSRIVPRLRRLVRDTARALDRPVVLKLEGEAMDADAAVIRDLAEALPHMLRNALDHAIEPAAERQALGKLTDGSLSLRFAQVSDAFLVRVEDDGRGMDPDAVLERALRRGLVTEDEGARMSREERLRLIFLPGFSTRDEASELSGRGVGMEVVAEIVERHRGRIGIQTESGRGTCFTLRFPILFRYEEYLVVELDGRPVGLPVHYIVELISRGEAPVVEDGLVVLRTEALPVIGLRALDPRFGGSERRALVVLGLERGRVAMAADRLLGFAGTLIQPLPDRDRPPYLSGVGRAHDGRQLWGVDLEKVGHDVDRYRVEGWDSTGVTLSGEAK